MTEPRADWEAIEREYRAGQISSRAIASAHGITEGAIRKRAKAEGWQRSLADRVREAVREKLVRADGTQEGTQAQRASDKEITESAASRGVELVRQHRASLSRANRIVSKLLAELESGTDNAEEIEETVEIETAGDKDTKRRNQMLRAVSLPGRAATARELSQTLKNLIPLERQAFNLDTDAGEEVAKLAADMSDRDRAKALAALVAKAKAPQ